MRKKAKKTPNDYPRVCFRIDQTLLADLDRAKEISQQSYGQILAHCLRKHLPDFVKFHSPAQ